MNNAMETADSIFLAPGDFPMLGAERMCPRCQCCGVGVAPYKPPVEVSILGIRWVRVIPLASSLLPEPSGSGDEAWFCCGGCNEKGKHPQNKGRRKTAPPFPSLIGRVRK
jgi:hypothetical protein